MKSFLLLLLLSKRNLFFTIFLLANNIFIKKLFIPAESLVGGLLCLLFVAASVTAAIPCVVDN